MQIHKLSRFTERLRELGFENYEAFLASELWANKKREYAESKRPQKCQHCDSPNFILHHLTYENLGAENLADFLPLCAEHHRALHEFMQGYGWQYQATQAMRLLRMHAPLRGKPIAAPKKLVADTPWVQALRSSLEAASLEDLRRAVGIIGDVIHQRRPPRQFSRKTLKVKLKRAEKREDPEAIGRIKLLIDEMNRRRKR